MIIFTCYLGNSCVADFLDTMFLGAETFIDGDDFYILVAYKSYPLGTRTLEVKCDRIEVEER